MTSRRALPLATLLFATFAMLATTACDKKSDTEEPAGGPAKIEDLGVVVELPAGWKYAKRGAEHWVTKSTMYGARLSKKDAMPGSLDDAIAGWIQGTASDKGEVSGGGYYAVIETEFPAGDGGDPMKLPFVQVVLPLGDAAVECGGQLQTGDDPKPLLEVCKSIKPL
jgi:hypothetical protein